MKKLLLMSLFVIGSLNLNANVSENNILSDCSTYATNSTEAEQDFYGWMDFNEYIDTYHFYLDFCEMFGKFQPVFI